MTYIPKPGERVRVLEIHPDDPYPMHAVGDVVTASEGTEPAMCDEPGWCYLASGGVLGTWCRVELAPAEAPTEAPEPVTVRASVRVRAYAVIANAVELAIDGAVERVCEDADDCPSLRTRLAVRAACTEAVMLALNDVLDFGDE